ncbi:Zinc finger protein ZAT12 [Linum grandiflorum]
MNLTVANCLMLLSQAHQANSNQPTSLFLPSYDVVNVDRSSPSRVFECKTCNRQFPSFQALGGHRASHKKPRDGSSGQMMMMMSPPKPKTHECSICGLEFAIGQALGGHMRRHRASRASVVAPTSTSEEDESSSPSTTTDEDQEAPPMKKARVSMSLDLNLTPFENDVKMFKLGKAAPLVHCFY